MSKVRALQNNTFNEKVQVLKLALKIAKIFGILFMKRIVAKTFPKEAQFGHTSEGSDTVLKKKKGQAQNAPLKTLSVCSIAMFT